VTSLLNSSDQRSAASSKSEAPQVTSDEPQVLSSSPSSSCHCCPHVGLRVLARLQQRYCALLQFKTFVFKVNSPTYNSSNIIDNYYKCQLLSLSRLQIIITVMFIFVINIIHGVQGRQHKKARWRNSSARKSACHNELFSPKKCMYLVTNV